MSPAGGRYRYYGEWLPVGTRSRLHPDMHANRQRTIDRATSASPAMLLLSPHRNEQPHWTSPSTPVVPPGELGFWRGILKALAVRRSTVGLQERR